MIPFQEISTLSKGMPLETMEKDYAINWLLAGLSQSALNKDIIFYGGTALKKMYFPAFRFSEDLDFLSEKDIPLKHILKELDQLYVFIRKTANISFSTGQDTINRKEDRLQLFIKYDGFPEINLAKQVKFDLVLNQKTLGPPLQKELVWVYSDKIKTKLRVYSLEAIIAEKISAILDLSRKEPRDIFDLDYLLKHSKPDKNKVLRYLKMKLGFTPSLSSLLDNINNNVYARRWEIRLKPQVLRLGKIEIILKRLDQNLKTLYHK